MFLAGAWRSAPPPLPSELSNVEPIVPLLAESGAGGLAWHRLRQTALRSHRAVRELQQHYRLQTLQAARRASAVRELLLRLRAYVSIEPILIKGWSSAQLYPEPGLRPSADIDLCVPANELQAAASVLAGRPLPCAVDLHSDIPDLEDRSWREVFDRSFLVPLDDVAARVLGAEDELRLLCLHLARHGIARPLWLCDVAARLESLPISFDLAIIAAEEERSQHATGCPAVLVLANRLLAADLSAVPPARHRAATVEWRKAAAWCKGIGSGRPLRHYPSRNPGEIVRRVRYHGISPRQGIHDAHQGGSASGARTAPESSAHSCPTGGVRAQKSSPCPSAPSGPPTRHFVSIHDSFPLNKLELGSDPPLYLQQSAEWGSSATLTKQFGGR